MRVAIAISGGFDSATSALLLKRQGHQVIGLHMLIHEASEEIRENAHRVAKQVGIEVVSVDLRDKFAEVVVEPFLKGYECGFTPSPCPICNRHIKMDYLLRYAAVMGCDKLATGHYAAIADTEGGAALFKGMSIEKDQSYFLFMLTRDMLGRLMFPLGSMSKEQVRTLAGDAGLSVAGDEESQELCFIPHGDYRVFLERKGVKSRPGPIKDLEGKVLGTHKGITAYTIGQRRGLGISSERPYYVIRIHGDSNTVIVGRTEDTRSSVLRISEVNLLTSRNPLEGSRYQVKVRSTTTPSWATVQSAEGGRLTFRFDTPQSGVAPGQAAVFYEGDRVMGGGWILPEEEF
ncbi:MAG: tRNA 2-thiouridine(34) synthase MnmA [Pseudomonadota bacterium]